MALVRGFEDHEYWPEYSTFLLRDTAPGGPARVVVGELLAEYAVDTQPCGSVARAGDGWLDGQAPDAHHTVRLEAHDSEPEPDAAAWADVMETPLASGGTMALSMVTGGSHGDPFRLGQPGLYRARFCRRPAEERNSYLVQFWPVDAPPDPPRWIARSRPFVEKSGDGWAEVLGWKVWELIGAVRQAAVGDRATVKDVAAWALRHHRPESWLSEPLSPTPPPNGVPAGRPTATGPADPVRGAGPDATRQRVVDLAEAARQLGTAPPVTRADLLPLLAAAGLLSAGADTTDGPAYRVVERPRPVWEVLRLPDEQLAAIRRGDAHRRYCYAVSDVISLLLWAHEGGTTVTLGWLADRLLTSPPTVRDIIDFAIETGKLNASPESDAPEPDTSEPERPNGHDGARESGGPPRPDDPDGLDTPLRLSVPPRQPPPARPPQVATSTPGQVSAAAGAWRLGAVLGARKAAAVKPAKASARATGARMSAVKPTTARPMVAKPMVARSQPSQPAPPAGAPPRAGVVGRNGELVLWRDGQPVVHAAWPESHVSAALQSRYGTVLLASTQAVLFDHDGQPHRLGTDLGWRAAIDPTGQRLALVETHIGRRSRGRLHLFDLGDRSRQTMPWPEDDAHLWVIAVRDGAVYFRPQQSDDTTWRWLPGSDPQPLPYRLHGLDPYTGTALASDRESGMLLIDPDGTVQPLAAEPTAALAPGARYLYTWRHEAPALVLSDVSAPEQTRTLQLPAGSRTRNAMSTGPIWEDHEHVLVAAEHGRNGVGVPLVRMDVRTGAIEGVALPDILAYRPLLVEPLPESQKPES
jgi:hypothetical protein